MVSVHFFRLRWNSSAPSRATRARSRRLRSCSAMIAAAIRPAISARDRRRREAALLLPALGPERRPVDRCHQVHRLPALRRGVQARERRPGDAHHFRTWVERYVYLEGEDKPAHRQPHDPVNIEASGSEQEYRFANRYKDAKVEKAFFVPKLCNHCTHPACVQVCPTGATYRTEDGVVLIDHKYCIGCQYCVQACPYGARFFNDEKGVFGQVHVVLPPHYQGIAACVRRGLPGRRAHLRRSAGQAKSDQPVHPQQSQRACSSPNPAMPRTSFMSASTRM